MSFVTDLRFALRSLLRARGLTLTVVLTLALGIGANAAIFSVVRGVLLKPLTNRDEDRLIYIRQSAPGLATPNTTFSVPEIDDLKARVKTVAAFGDFSTIGFTMIGLGEPRVVSAGVVSGSYFEVMGLRPVLGRLINASDDGPSAAGAVVLTHRFWTTALKSDPSVIGKTVRLDSRVGTVVGVLEPAVPYPTETEIIANVVTSPHHLSATMVTGRVHRMTELFGRLAPGADLETARADLRAAHGAMLREHPEVYPAQVGLPHRRRAAARSDHRPGTNHPADSAGGFRTRLRHRLLERREPDPGALGAARGRTCGAGGARRTRECTAANAARREPAALRRGRGLGRAHGAADGRCAVAVRCAILRPRAGRHGRFEPALDRRRALRSSPRCFSRSSRGCRRRKRRAASACRMAAPG